jgi:hypothetical protein
MKTIQISDETYAFLKDLAEKLNTQDNRCTANPRYYAIREKDTVCGMGDGYTDDYVYVRGDWECDTLEEAFECECEAEEIEKQGEETAIHAIRREWDRCFASRVKQYGDKELEDLHRILFPHMECVANPIHKITSESDEDILIDLLGWRKVGIRHTEKFSNCFLTEEAAKQHIRINRHNLRSPDTFLFHAYRNQELDMVIKAIKEIGNNNEDR